MSKYYLFTLGLMAVVLRVNGLEAKPIAGNNIGNILLKSRSLIAASPEHSMECFSIYIPKLNELNRNYEVNYEACLARSTEDRRIVDLERRSDRENLEDDVEEICARYTNCTNLNESAYDFFECFTKEASESIKDTCKIQNISKDKRDYVKLKYEAIEYDKNRCTDKYSRAYVQESTKLYEDLDQCLAGVKIQTGVTTTSTEP